MKKLFKTKDGDKTAQAQPGATKTTKTPQPTPHDPKSVAGKSDTAERIEEAEREDGTKPREHTDAVTAQREPVSAPRSQDADQDANKGVTITTEGGTPVAHPGSTLR